MSTIGGTSSISNYTLGVSGLASGTKTPGADIFSPQSAAKPPSPQQVSFAAEVEKLAKYRAEYEEAMMKKRGSNDLPPDTIAVAMPVDAAGRTPFVTADQQQLIDSITGQFAGKDNLDELMEMLTRAGVNPQQIAAKADYFISPGGKVETRGGEQLNNIVDIRV